jgi:phenylalanyl-tRNA synthetase alpha chain
MKNEKLPFRVIGPGSVFRCDSDVSHAPNFHQLEGFLVDQNVSMSDLKGVLSYFAKEFFGGEIKVRFRPSYFPFTEPSFEMALSCPFCQKKGCYVCSQSGWIELLGCGMINPNVLKMGGIDPTVYTGFAGGLGLDRLVMMKYGIEDVRHFESAKLDFLRQFA